MNSPPTKVRKRVREACDRCRRKKAACSGQKPVCSLCSRLGQECTWTGARSALLEDTHDISGLAASYQFVPDTDININEPSALEERVVGLDEKVTEVLDQVRWLASSRSLPRLDEDSEALLRTPDDVPLPAADVMRNLAELYLQFCHCQPLPLFDSKHFIATINAREVELRLCVAALALRFRVPDMSELGQQAQHVQWLRLARQLVMKHIIDGTVELSTLQSLCLLSLSEFNDGSRQQSGIYLSLATGLARAARLDFYSRHKVQPSQADEHNRCLWSIIMLQYLCGDFGPLTLTIETAQLRYPTSNSANELASTNHQSDGGSQLASSSDLGIESYAIQMTEVWYEVRQWTHQRGKLDQHPPWSGESRYHKIMLHQMEVESRLPYKHRFKPSGFADHAISDLSVNRSYWVPWLYLQIIYHSIVCTLNHPLLLSIYLRRFRVNQIPELFLQHTADLISSHTDWIIHLLEVAHEKQFQFSDPLIGQTIAIVATIFLQQSYTEDVEKRAERQAKYSTCFEFVQELGKYWSCVNQLAVDLRQFERMVTRAYESSTVENVPNMSNQVDLTAFWKILDNTQISRLASNSKSIFGNSLRPIHPSMTDGEVLSRHPLPEPTRVHSLSKTSTSAQSTPAGSAVGYNSVNQMNDMSNPSSIAQAFDQNIDTPFLAQDFFALGQDFVGNVDDWFTWTNT